MVGIRDVPHHRVVKHSVGEYVDNMVHTNGIESFWALLKRGYMGTYHHMSVKHLHRYVNEFAGRHNVRGLDTLKQLTLLAMGMVGKVLSYDELTDKKDLSWLLDQDDTWEKRLDEEAWRREEKDLLEYDFDFEGLDDSFSYSEEKGYSWD